MSMPRFIPTAEVKRLTRGSYEHIIVQLEEKIRESAEELFDADTAIHILGTFPGYVLVATEEGTCARVRYEGLDSGGVKIVKVEEVKVPSYSVENVDEFLRSESERVVELFRKGEINRAAEGLRGLALHSEGWPSPRQEETVEALLKMVSTERPWTRLFEARKDQIQKALWGSLRRIEEARLRPRFRKLYDGSVGTGEFERFRDLVEDRFRVLDARLDAFAGHVREAQVKMQAAAKEVERLGEGEALTTFAAFTEDLLEDVSRITKIAIKSSKQVRRVDSLGRLHDAIVERFSDMEIAGHFVSQLANRLSGAHQEEH
jgi:hypothetical protein